MKQFPLLKYMIKITDPLQCLLNLNYKQNKKHNVLQVVISLCTGIPRNIYQYLFLFEERMQPTAYFPELKQTQEVQNPK